MVVLVQINWTAVQLKDRDDTHTINIFQKTLLEVHAEIEDFLAIWWGVLVMSWMD